MSSFEKFQSITKENLHRILGGQGPARADTTRTTVRTTANKFNYNTGNCIDCDSATGSIPDGGD